MAFVRRSGSMSFALRVAGVGLVACSVGFAQGRQNNTPEQPAGSSQSERAAAAAASPRAIATTPDSTTEGTVTVGGQAIAYKAVAGTLTVGSTDAQDATLGFEGKPAAGLGGKAAGSGEAGGGSGDGADVLCGVLQEGCDGGTAAGDVSV